MVRLRDPATGHNLPTYEESEAARQEKAEALRQEAAARQVAEARAVELEARLRDLENALSPPETARTRNPP